MTFQTQFSVIPERVKKIWFNDFMRIYPKCVSIKAFERKLLEYFEEERQLPIVKDLANHLYQAIRTYILTKNNTTLIFYLNGLDCKGYLNAHRFIYDDLYLIPEVNIYNRKQMLYMIQLKGTKIIQRDVISCIHVAIQSLSVEEFTEATHTEADYKELVDDSIGKFNTQTSEYNNVIADMEVLEIFKAFDIWAKGIADGGIEGLQIQREIESAVLGSNQLVLKLLSFLVKCYPEFLFEYVENVMKRCKFNGTYHYGSLLANFHNIYPSLREQPLKYQYAIMRYVFDALRSIEEYKETIGGKIIGRKCKTDRDIVNEMNLFPESMDLLISKTIKKFNFEELSYDQLYEIYQHRDILTIGKDRFHILNIYENYNTHHPTDLKLELIVDFEM